MKTILRSLYIVLFVFSLSLNSAASDKTPTYSVKLYTQSGIDAVNEGNPTLKEGSFFSRINDHKAKLNQMRKEIRTIPKEQQMALALRIRETETELRKIFGDLIQHIKESQAEDSLAPEVFKNAKALLVEEAEIIKTEIDYIQSKIDNLRQSQEDLDTVQLFARKQAISKNYQFYDSLLNDFLENCHRKEILGIAFQLDLKHLDSLLKQRAATVASEIKLIVGKLKDLSKQYNNASKKDKETIQAQITAVEAQKEGLTHSLTKIVELFHERGMKTTEYSELLLKSTGQISSEILNKDVAFSLASNWIKFGREWVDENGIAVILKIIFVFFILFAFRLIALLAKRLVKKTFGRKTSNVSSLMSNFFISMSGKLIMIIGVIVAMSQLGLKVAPLLAGLGVVGFIVGFALQDVLSNFASGVMILIYQPFDVGDTIEVPEASGYVQHMNLVSTIILTYDNQKLIVPNNKIWGNIIRNVHSENLRRVDLLFGISYEADIDHAEKVMREVLNSHELVLDQPEPRVKLHNLGDSSVDFIVRPWTRTEHYWEVYWDITRSMKKRFDDENISIPYPQRDVHIINEA